jgi:hypothetical protein
MGIANVIWLPWRLIIRWLPRIRPVRHPNDSNA